MTEPVSEFLTPDAARLQLAERVELLRRTERRIVIGLTGGPGVGKSTLAAELVATLNEDEPGAAALVPMDGFHMRHSKLEHLGLVRDKGAPHTFEGAAFVAFLAGLKTAKGRDMREQLARLIDARNDSIFEQGFAAGRAARVGPPAPSGADPVEPGGTPKTYPRLRGLG